MTTPHTPPPFGYTPPGASSFLVRVNEMGEEVASEVDKKLSVEGPASYTGHFPDVN